MSNSPNKHSNYSFITKRLLLYQKFPFHLFFTHRHTLKTPSFAKLAHQNSEKKKKMVVKMMKWRPWPPLSSKKFEAKITVHRITGLQLKTPDSLSRLTVEIKWKGSKGVGLSSLRRKGVRRNFTKEGSLIENGVVEWNEEFGSFCSLGVYKEGTFHPWEVSLTVFNGLKQGPNKKPTIVASASLNLAEFASAAERQGREINIPLAVGGTDSSSTTTSLYLTVILLEPRSPEEPSEAMPRPILFFPRSPCYGELFSAEKDEISARKPSPKRGNIFKGLSMLRAKRTGHEEEPSDETSSVRSEDPEFNSSPESDSFDDSDAEDSEEVNENLCVTKSFDYGTLAYANHAGAIYSTTSGSEDEDWIYHTHGKSDAANTIASAPEQPNQQNTKRRLLPWRKRKLSFRTPKVKGEPLLKKHYGEEGGDDIDFDRRQLSSSDESNSGTSVANRPSSYPFGDDDFAVGIWEHKETISRDAHMKLKTQVFYASIDQRSERAAGESACTALVAVIADWLQSNHDLMPIKSQLDCLIREGSLEWRNLCDNVSYRERFPDKHFDLETVLEAKVRPISIVPQKSFVGFFHPEGVEGKGLDFLQGAMSFDTIWDEICLSASEILPSGDPLVYIVSWNDHFFVLKVDQDAYYIIDTLGERLHEGCNQAFILKFDKDTTIHRIGNEIQTSDNDKKEKSKAEGATVKNEVASGNEASRDVEEESTVVCSGKESCREYIKSFLAAIPIRELEVDLKKGLMSSIPLHQRLQIEFHYTKCLDSAEGMSPAEATDEQ